MLILVSILILVICLFLIAAVLIQNPKEGGIDASMGGNVSNQLFGAAQSAEGIERWTWYIAGSLFVLCLVAAML